MSSQTESAQNQTSQLSSTPASAWKGPPILALIIGINKYTAPTVPCLRGAVADADVFQNFLKECLNVPNANIINLRDEQASRASILSAFISLRDNAKYNKDEAAVIVYFAGHEPEERIEILCPSDIGCPSTVRVNGVQRDHVIQGIPGRLVSVHLTQISDVKGNNITLILDCCFSAGTNRGVDFEESENLIRRISKPFQIKSNPDKEFWSHGRRGKFDTSHVLLAACGRDQKAWEDSVTKQGIFTSSLMKVLRGNDINKITYTSLIDKMEMPKWQTPHCEGQGVNRRIFNKSIPTADSSFILGKCELSRIILQAGAAQGVTVGSRIAVHAYNFFEVAGIPNPCLGYLIVNETDTFSSVLQVPSDAEKFQLPALFYCLIDYRTSLNIALYCEDKPWLKTIFPPEKHRLLAVTIVDDVESCDLQLAVIDGNVYFDRHNVLVTPHIGARISHTVAVGDVSAIRNVVQSSLCFYHNLMRIGNDNLPGVRMELNRLTEGRRADFGGIFAPTGNNLIADEPATIVVDESAFLGMTIINPTDLPLYPYLFYFDPTDLTITEWYRPPLGAGLGRVDVSLPAHSRLPIGYGGGVPSWQFALREGDKKDIGFFKLFLSTWRANFSSILQESPFDSGMSRYGRPGAVQDLDPPQLWATQLVTVIQVES